MLCHLLPFSLVQLLIGPMLQVSNPHPNASGGKAAVSPRAPTTEHFYTFNSPLWGRWEIMCSSTVNAYSACGK